MIRLPAVLGIITCIAALALGFVHRKTAPKIEEQKRITDEVARRTALPQATYGTFVEVESDGFVYYEGYRCPDTTGIVGYAVKAEGTGYSSNIETIVGIDLAGRITGMKITSQQETPGLGSRIEEVRSKMTVLDALKELSGGGEGHRVAVEMVDTAGVTLCIEMEIRDELLCGEVERMVASGDTAGLMGVAPRAFWLEPQDSLRIFCDPGLTFKTSGAMLEKLRSEVTPWFQQQFVGKSYADLILTSQETDKNIQAITGATISSGAVTESVKEAIKRLEVVIGGFKEASP